MEPETNHRHATTEPPSTGDFDADYANWKAWHGGRFGVFDRVEEAYLETLFRRVRVVPARGWRVLESGFGNGKFLGFGRTRGWRIDGTECNAGLVSVAHEAGFSAHHSDNLAAFATGEFDFVVAFDVLEHLPRAALSDMLVEVRRVLKAGGVFLARFPNSDSPLGLAYQNGDPTHCTPIGSLLADFLARRAGLEIQYLDADVAAMWGGSLKRILHGAVVTTIAALVNRAMRLLVFNFTNVTYFSANLVLVCRVPPDHARRPPPAGSTALLP